MRLQTRHYTTHTITPDEYISARGKVRPFKNGEEFELTFEPVEDSITVTRTRDGYEVRYLVQDDQAEAPDMDDNAFLVHYADRYLYITRDNVITKNDLANWYRGDFEDYADIAGCETCDGTGVVDENGEEKECPKCKGRGEIETLPGNIPQAAKYWIFPVAAYIHSGIALSLGSGRNFPDYQWDVSHVGAVLIAKEEWPEEAKAREYAAGLIETWNQYLSGDVYGITRETYDKDRAQVDQDSVWGFFGYKWAMEALKTEI